ncbi:MAG: tyrosine-type recombinase/integrase [Desulfovibrio sp.]|nr:tyrosine-type recombinase/integrase [Desulfovibrio sp.]
MSVHHASARDLWFAKWRDDGRERRKYFKTEAEARAYEAERLHADAAEEQRLTVGELAMLFFRSRPDYNAHTKKNIVYALAGHDDAAGRHMVGPAEFLRDKYADALTRRDLEAMREAMRARGAGNNTINKYQAYIRAILAWGVEQELIPINPWRDYKRLKTTRPIYQPTMDDFRRVYQQLPPYLQWAMETAFFLALRPGIVELFSLQWSAFNWRRGVVVIRQGKTGRLKTVVPHPAYMERAHARFEDDSRRAIVLVCHRDGQRVLSYKEAWRTACRRACVQMRPYDIRHLAATAMLSAGADLAAVAAQMGHSSVATTGATYAHITAGAQARAAAMMPELTDGDTAGDTGDTVVIKKTQGL